MLDLGKVAIEFAAQVDQDAIIGKFQKRFNDVFRAGRGFQRADAQGRLLLLAWNRGGWIWRSYGAFCKCGHKGKSATGLS